MFIEINISTCVFLPHSGGGLRTGASCSWDLEKICNWFAVKGPVRSSSAKLSLLCLEMVVTKEELIDYALAVNSDGRYLTTRGVDRHVHKTRNCRALLVHLIEVSRRALTVGRDRIMQLHKVICLDKAEKLDGGECHVPDSG
ncbi:hypothetical protein Bca52824_055665 [Brassica carinata]|uniref:Uncharacterized protein n=1 Tax=Brassica carinata TaxID=52824 RepID=A0A8X7ULM6_BRACI|nr:hypothetical protein Bca52824_055665 [Brassica carinata]